MPEVVRAISIRQPFDELILRGKKKIEYRSISTNIRERVFLYASRKPDNQAIAQALTRQFESLVHAGVLKRLHA